MIFPFGSIRQQAGHIDAQGGGECHGWIPVLFICVDYQTTHAIIGNLLLV